MAADDATEPDADETEQKTGKCDQGEGEPGADIEAVERKADGEGVDTGGEAKHRKGAPTRHAGDLRSMAGQVMPSLTLDLDRLLEHVEGDDDEQPRGDPGTPARDPGERHAREQKPGKRHQPLHGAEDCCRLEGEGDAATSIFLRDADTERQGSRKTVGGECHGEQQESTEIHVHATTRFSRAALLAASVAPVMKALARGMQAMLQIRNLTFDLAGRRLFEGASARIAAGRKVGLVGRNGAGKSTLFRLIKGELTPLSGGILVHPRARILSVAQEAPDGEEGPLEWVLAAHPDLAHAEAAASRARSAEEIAEAHIRLADLGAHSAEGRAARILAGLGFDEAAQQRPLREFSGGWRMRVALAATLFAEPDLLLLDEPSNYLDLEGVLWLRHHLSRYPHSVLIISHDRDLLDAVAGEILHLAAGRLTLYRGGYSHFLRQRLERLRHQRAESERIEAERRRIRAFVDRFRAKATKARQAQSRLKMLARLEPPPPVAADESPVRIAFPKPEPHLSPPLLVLDGVSVGYQPGRAVLRELTLRIDPDDRIALLGPNGEGKSTFARLLVGRLAPMRGRRLAPRKLSVGYFAQHQLDELDAAASAIEVVRRRVGERMTEARIRSHLGAFGLTGEMAERRVESLSGGERARLVFALISLEAPQLLVLDEPTNHLDIDAREALIGALNDYDGAVLLISHDRHLIGACADRLWQVGDGRVRPFEGDLEDYEQMVLESRSARAAAGGGERGGARADPRGRARRDRASVRSALAPLRRRAQMLEERLEAASGQRERILRALASPRLYAAPAPERARKTAELDRVRARLDEEIAAIESEWLALMERLEGGSVDGAQS